MTTYNINILNYDDTRSYDKDNIMIKDNIFYQALKYIHSDNDFNIGDWKVINDPDTLYNQKLFPDYLNLKNDVKPGQGNVPDTKKYFCIVNENNKFEQYFTIDKGITWVPKPIDNYNNLSIYLLSEKNYYSPNEEASKPLYKLNMNDSLIEIVFHHNFPYPISDKTSTCEIDFNNCKLKFSRSHGENDIELEYNDSGSNFTTLVLVDSENNAKAIDNNNFCAWNPGTYTLEFNEQVTVTNFIDGFGNSGFNNLPDLGAYISFVDTWILNEDIIEVNYDRQGLNPKVLNYTPSDMIKKIIIGDETPQVLEPDENKTITLPFVDTLSGTDGIVKSTGSNITFDEGVMSVENVNPTVYDTFDYGSKDALPNNWWDNHFDIMGVHSTYIDFHAKKEYKLALDTATNKYVWEYVKDIDLNPGQCVFVDKMVVYNPTEGDEFVPNVTWFNNNKFTHLNSDPTFVQHRTETRNIEATVPVTTTGVESYTFILNPVIDDLKNINNIKIRGTYLYTAFTIDESGEQALQTDYELPFNVNSMHGEFFYRYDDFNVRRMLIGLSNDSLVGLEDDASISDTDNPDEIVTNVTDICNIIYFMSEPLGYVKSISTLKNYTPFYMPSDIYATSFTKGIKLGVYPESGTGNVTIGWNFTPMVGADLGVAGIPSQPSDIQREVTIKGEIIVEYNY